MCSHSANPNREVVDESTSSLIIATEGEASTHLISAHVILRIVSYGVTEYTVPSPNSPAAPPFTVVP